MPTNSKEYMNNYYAKNKQQYRSYNRTLTCEDCHQEVSSSYWHRHVKTKKHLANAQRCVSVDHDRDLMAKLAVHVAEVRKIEATVRAAKNLK